MSSLRVVGSGAVWVVVFSVVLNPNRGGFGPSAG